MAKKHLRVRFSSVWSCLLVLRAFKFPTMIYGTLVTRVRCFILFPGIPIANRGTKVESSVLLTSEKPAKDLNSHSRFEQSPRGSLCACV
jgi:hypothetical protein